MIEVGKRYRHPTLPAAYYIDVLAIDGDEAWVRNESGERFARPVSAFDSWVEVKPLIPFPERWINVYSTYIAASQHSRADADIAAHSGRLAVLHVKPDRTVEVIEVDD